MSQLDLFPATVRAPQGFAYEPEFLTPDEEAYLLTYLNGLRLKHYEHGEYIAKRKIRWFADVLPEPLRVLRDRVAAWAGLHPSQLPNALVSRYEPGTPIGWHRDRPPYRAVLGVSLGGPASFRLRKRDGKGWKRFMQVAAPRSIYKMEGAARSNWQHSIPPVEALRYSITFRSL